MKQMKQLKRLLALTLVVMLVAALLAVPALASTDVVAAPDAENGIYYVDDAGVLSSETKDYIDSGNAALTSSCGGQVGVVTLEYLNDLDCEEYAYEVLNQWGVGDSEKNNGTVFVLVTMEKKCWITTGSGIEDKLTAGTLNGYLESYCYDDLDAGNYDAAVYNTVAALFDWYENYYEVSISETTAAGSSTANQGFGGGGYDNRQTGVQGESAGSRIGEFMSSLFALIVFVVIIVLVLGSRIFASPCFWCGGPRRRGPRGPRGPWGGGPRGGGFGGGGFGGGPHGGGGFGGGGFGGGHSGGFGGGGFGGGGGHGGGAGRR